MSQAVKIYFSLAPARQDRSLFEELRKQLSVLRQQGLVEFWHQSAASPGSNIREIARTQIREADIIVLLVSPDFFDSEQCAREELPYALEQHATRDTPVIPVLLRPIDLQGTPLAPYSSLPPDGKAISGRRNRDSILMEVARGIRRVIEERAARLFGAPEPVTPPEFPLYLLPYERSPFFTDRDEILATLRRSFMTGRTRQTRTLALAGLRGMGKTQLALAYAHLYHEKYRAIIWLNAETREHLSMDLLAVVRQLGIPAQDEVDEQERMRAVRRWLERHERWLVVFDNLDVDNFPLLKQLIPSRSSGHVLLITHSQTVGPFASSSVSVASMTREDSALLLLRRARLIPEQGSRDDAAEADYQQALAIAQEVEGYPLALDQAGAYIEETRCSLAAYLTLYRERQERLLEQRGHLAGDHPDPVTTTLSLTFEQVERVDPSALELLSFLAFLYPEALPDQMLSDGAHSLDGSLRALAGDSLVLHSALATLLRFSLIHRQADTTTLNIQRLIQAVLRKRLAKKEQLRLARQALRLVNAVFPSASFSDWPACERYALQAQHCAALIRELRLTLPEGHRLLTRLGAYYSRRGCFAEAEEALTLALRLQERARSAEPANLAETLNALGLLYQRQARYQEAETQLRRALDLRARIDHPRTAESLHNLALLYGDLGDYQQAEQLYQRALALEERAKGPDHPDVASTLNNLALMYYHQGNYAQAEASYRRALAIYERAEHPDIIYPLDGLGALAEAQGDYQQAGQLYQRAATICEETYGEIHSGTAHSLNKLADIAEAQGDYQQAEALYRRALSISEQALGPEHPDVALFLNNLAFLLQEQGQHQQAEALYQRSLAMYEQALGPEHPDVASVLYNLARLAHRMHNDAQAEALLRRGLAIYEQRGELSQPDAAYCLSALAELLSARGAYEEAARYFEQALAILLQAPGAEQQYAALVREKYAALQERMKSNRETQEARREDKGPPATPSA